MFPTDKEDTPDRRGRLHSLRFAVDLVILILYIAFGRRLPHRRYGDIGPEGRFLFGMLLWILVLAVIDRGVVRLIEGARSSDPTKRPHGLIALAAGFSTGMVFVYLRYPPELFAWFEWAFEW